MDTIDIRGIDRAELLAALFNAAAPGQNMALLHFDADDRMTTEEARRLLGDGQPTRFNYHKGRVLKCDVMHDDFRPALYDRDNGRGLAAEVIASLKEDKT